MLLDSGLLFWATLYVDLIFISPKQHIAYSNTNADK